MYQMLSLITMWLGVGVFILGLRHLGLLKSISRYVIGVWYIAFGILILSFGFGLFFYKLEEGILAYASLIHLPTLLSGVGSILFIAIQIKSHSIYNFQEKAYNRR